MAEGLLARSSVSLGLTSLPGGAPQGHTIAAFEMKRQEQTQWCWAAVTASVSALHNNVMTQCSIVNKARSLSSCCLSGGSSACNQPWFLDQALQLNGYLARMSTGSISWSALINELDQNRPVCVRMSWVKGGGHFIAVGGYSTSGIVEVNDPFFGDSSVNFNTFISSYLGAGTWTHTYLTTATAVPVPPTQPACDSFDPWQPSQGTSSTGTPSTCTPSTGTVTGASTNPPPATDPWQPQFS